MTNSLITPIVGEKANNGKWIIFGALGWSRHTRYLTYWRNQSRYYEATISYIF